MSAAPAVEARNIFKSFGSNDVLHDVSVTVPVGDARALVGRNGAGKSTLVGLLTGLYPSNRGEITFSGAPAPSLENRKAWRELVACVYQRWMIVPQLSVAENLFLNNPQRKGARLVDWRRMRERAMAVLKDWDVAVEPEIEAWRLTVEQRQIVEIARALLQGSRFIILDEPTAELERREVSRLFDRVRRLQENGVTFLYISHHLEEIYEICRSVTVLRDGRVVADTVLGDLPKPKLVAAMVGDAVAPYAASGKAKQTDAAVGLEVRQLNLPGRVEDVDLAVRAGECVGLAGLAGSGKEDVGKAIAGLATPKSGSILIDGQAASPGRVGAMRSRGVGYVANDRHIQGLFPLMSLADNLSVTIWRRLGRLGFIAFSAQRHKAEAQIRELGIVAASAQQAIGELSGGNQQKAMVGRALASDPKVLVLSAPTQGVDVASKQALFGIIERAKIRGMAVLVISDDLDELAICDRLEIIFRGKIVRSFSRGWDEREVVAAIEGLY